mmetsp:Transcript_35655/g.54553  ORF Transcript_35655/g.54553 Transcript_35655/m.54553 type:complete len:134 (-) Transcript_35655:290-691(-)|eukprot:CAMPEP_0170483484 /NCGR_PEP_ID=MMETSP0208-20121228/3153_1 /TAXON_ID=197538 /ORGANISM="Strombidium inclinatum, Strain S3" /LENGTH=133 /DNA_ID=CAMNT_0010756537 /DNA_START=1 /DNA_END=402 /DNA_ORIENTATION=-
MDSGSPIKEYKHVKGHLMHSHHTLIDIEMQSLRSQLSSIAAKAACLPEQSSERLEEKEDPKIVRLNRKSTEDVTRAVALRKESAEGPAVGDVDEEPTSEEEAATLLEVEALDQGDRLLVEQESMRLDLNRRTI